MNVKAKGFSLLEMVISLAVISCLVLILSYFSQNVFMVFGNIEKTKAMTEVMEQLRFTLASGEQCSLNLKDLPFDVANTAGIPIPRLSTFDNNTKLRQSDIVVSSEAQKILLIPVSQVNTGLISANLQINFQPRSAGSAAAVSRVLPIVVRVQQGNIQECWLRKDRAQVEVSQLCITLTGGALDMLVGMKCELANGKWFVGSSSLATCPSGTLLPPNAKTSTNCDASFPPGFKDEFPKTDVPVVSRKGMGSVRRARDPILLSLDTASSTCYCDAAMDIPTAIRATFSCKILCLVP